MTPQGGTLVSARYPTAGSPVQFRWLPAFGNICHVPGFYALASLNKPIVMAWKACPIISACYK